jgi:hypothetical protein
MEGIVMFRLVPLLSVAVVFLLSPGFASSGGPDDASAPSVVALTAEAPVLIEAPEGAGFRVLVSFADLDRLVGKTVVSARLLLPHLGVTETLTLEAKAVTRAWDAASVSWSSPWETPGGDFDDGLRGSYRVTPDREAARPVGFNVSTAVRAIADGEVANHGFLIKVSGSSAGDDGEDRGAEIPAEAVSGLVSGGTVRLLVTCASGS